MAEAAAYQSPAFAVFDARGGADEALLARLRASPAAAAERDAERTRIEAEAAREEAAARAAAARDAAARDAARDAAAAEEARARREREHRAELEREQRAAQWRREDEVRMEASRAAWSAAAARAQEIARLRAVVVGLRVEAALARREALTRGALLGALLGAGAGVLLPPTLSLAQLGVGGAATAAIPALLRARERATASADEVVALQREESDLRAEIATSRAPDLLAATAAAAVAAVIVAAARSRRRHTGKAGR